MKAKETIEFLLQNGRCTLTQARELCLAIMDGLFTPAQIASLLTVFRMRGVSVDEICGFREAAMERALPLKINCNKLFDLCGTGGDGKGTFNISTISAVVLAACGVPIAKHGNYAISSKCGSSNVLEALGYVFSSESSKINKQIEQCNLCFLHAPNFYPAFKVVAPVRAELGIKTIFNLLGPLLNPLSPNAQMIGVYSLELVRLFKLVGQALGKQFTVVHTLDGSDEVTLTDTVRISSSKEDLERSPEQLGFSRITYKSIAEGEDINSSKDIFISVLVDKATLAQKDVVVANSGIALWSVRRANAKEVTLEECFDEVRRKIESKEAYKLFCKVIEISKE